MYNKTLITETLEQIETVIDNLLESTDNILDINDLSKSADGILRLNGICMSFIIIGEEVKRIDKYTERQFLSNYPTIQWDNVMGLRNRIAHGYFEIDIDVILDTLKNDIPLLLTVIKQMKTDLE
jgi:uncharacterized protein with HEPN domain